MIIDYKKQQTYLKPTISDIFYDRFCFFSEELKLGYIPIPRNLSKKLTFMCRSSYGHLFKDARYTDYLDRKDIKWLVVLREPMDRWYSGIGEFLKVNHMLDYLKDDKFKDVLIKGLVFDNHTEKQIIFLDQLDTDNCVFFDSTSGQSDVGEQIESYLDKNYNIKINLLGKESPNSHIHMLKDYVEKSVLVRDGIQRFYEDDYRLLRTVSWLNKFNNYTSTGVLLNTENV